MIKRDNYMNRISHNMLNGEVIVCFALFLMFYFEFGIDINSLALF